MKLWIVEVLAGDKWRFMPSHLPYLKYYPIFLTRAEARRWTAVQAVKIKLRVRRVELPGVEG